MGSDSILGLLFEINADPSKAADALQAFEKSTGQSFERTAAGTKPLDTALLSNRESVRLLSEELGVHMPRAVSGALAEIMPGISAIGPALLGAFALAEIPKFIDGIKEATDEISGFGKEAKKAFEGAVAASDEAIVKFKTIKEGIKLENEVNRNIAALTVQRDVLDSTGGSAVNWARAVMAFLSGQAVQAGAFAAMAQQEKLDIGQLAKLEDQRFQQLNTRTKLEDDAHKKRTEAAKQEAKEEAEYIRQALEGFNKEDDLLREQAMWRIKAGQEAAKVMAADSAAIEKQAQDQQYLNQLDLQFLNILDQITGVEQRQAQIARTAAPAIGDVTAQTKHLSIARKELIGVTQDLHQLEDLFTDALHGEMDGLIDATQQMGEIGDEIGELIGNTKIAAEIKGGFDAALSIEYLAKFIASYGTDASAGLASLKYGLAAAEMFKVAGKSGHSAGAGGGGMGGGGGYGSRDAGYGSRDTVQNPQTLAPGAASQGGRFGSPGSGIVIVHGSSDFHAWIAAVVTEAANRGNTVISTSSQRGAPVGH